MKDIESIDLEIRYNLLVRKFNSLLVNDLSESEWEKFSGEFNRFNRKMIEETPDKRDKLLYEYLISVWTAMFSYYSYKFNIFKLFKIKESKNRLIKTKELFKELLKYRKLGYSYRVMLSKAKVFMKKE